MAEHALWHSKRVTPASPVWSVVALRGRLWIVCLPLLLAFLGAWFGTRVQATLWRSHASVSFRVPTNNTILWAPPEFFAQKQASLARSPEVARRVVRVAGVKGLTAAQFLRHSSAKAASAAGSPLPLSLRSDYAPYGAVSLSVSYGDRATAVELARAYATTFTRYKGELEARSTRKGLARIAAILSYLRAHGRVGSGRYRDTLGSLRENKRLGSQFVRHRQVAGAVSGASSVRPHALRNGLLAGALGAFVGVALVLGIVFRRQGRGSQSDNPEH